jgi:hypothetical protein
MKRQIRWLRTVELPALPQATWIGPDKTPKPAKTGFRVFEKGDETTVDIRAGKIFIKRLGALPTHLVEATDFEFVDSNSDTALSGNK